MDNATDKEVEFDFNEEEPYIPIYDDKEERVDEGSIDETEETDIRDKFKKFFSKKDEEDKKFMIYDDGDIKYIKDNKDINYEDVINHSNNKIKEKTAKYSRKDYLRVFLICYLILLPIIYYKYYYTAKPLGNKLSEPEELLVEEDNDNKKDIGSVNKDKDITNTIKKPKPLETKDNLSNTNNANSNEYYENIANEIAKYNNENINNIRLYFNNRYNRGALKTSLEKNLTGQKNLYVHIETNKSYYNKQQDDVNALLATLLNDIATTTELLEQIDNKFTKENVNAIFNKYQNSQ